MIKLLKQILDEQLPLVIKNKNFLRLIRRILTRVEDNNNIDDNNINNEEIIKKLATQILNSFSIEDPEKFLEEAKKLDQELLLNKITPHLTQWSMDGAPICAGEHFVIIRSWQQDLIKENAQYKGRRPIIIDPGIAFGWAHATTLVTLELLEKYWQGGHMLDVGVGSGVLTIAGAFLQPDAYIDAFDISIDIVETAEAHLEVNRVLDKDKITLKHTDITAYKPFSYDLITANLLPSIFIEIKTELVKRLKPGGIIILSGFSDQNEVRTTASFDWLPMVSDIRHAETYNMQELFEGLGLELVDKRERLFDKKESLNSKEDKHWVALAMRAPKTNN